MDSWIILSVICLFLACVSSQESSPICIPVSQCTTDLKDNTYLQALAKNLTCGFVGNEPIINCPHPFLEIKGIKLLPKYSVCGIQNNERIFGGEKTDIDEYPWMALLKYQKRIGSGYYCGGVLISSRYVLTAAHCVNGSDIPRTWKLTEVRLGEWNTSSEIDCLNDDCNLPPVNVPIEKTIVHEGYNAKDGHQQNDIALIRLARNVQFTEFVKPICLPVEENLRKQKYTGWDMTVAGWGKTETKSMSDVKLKVSLPIIDPKECKTVYSAVTRLITNNQMCAGGSEGQDSCRGDSGGPLMAEVSKNWFVFGVVSYGPSPCGSQGWPGVYTRVTAYIYWILANMEE
ncbi:unnamed protein product [Leptosia nina]|uniref:Peptidase S1 domain-containing protein n=1 Tax=Leptosia nina TaxID=320188 RepID=A0AAV1JPE4_9NEOP